MIKKSLTEFTLIVVKRVLKPGGVYKIRVNPNDKRFKGKILVKFVSIL